MPRQYTYEEVKKYIEEDGNNILLSETYVNNKEKLSIKCENNHIFTMSFHDFKAGCRCRMCYKNREKQKKKM